LRYLQSDKELIGKMAEPESTPLSIGEQIFNGVKLVAELVFVPGASQIVEGRVGSGILYAGGGFAARYLLPGVLGPVGWIAVALDSYSVSASGRHLWEPAMPSRRDEEPARPE
jgi:hypothetical protein